MSNKFVGFLEAAGKDFLKGLGFVVKYAVPVSALVALIFPPAAAGVAEAGTVASLIQHAIILVEQKYAASGVQNGTGAQKQAEVLVLVEQAVLDVLSKVGVQADSAYVQRIINAVVAILNVQSGQVLADAK